MKRTQIVLGFCKHNALWLLLYVLQLSLLFFVCALYRIPLHPICYAGLLMTLLALLFCGKELHDYAAGIRRLERLQRLASSRLDEQLPTADLQERLFGELIQSLEKRCRSLQQKAQQQESATAQYYTIWSHQAKTPLAALRLLLREDVPDRGALEQELFKAEQYVDMALEYQRLTASCNDLILRRYSIESIVKQAVKAVSTLFIHKKIGIELGRLNGMVLTDQKWLLFALEQILTNAVKYTPVGTVTIWCEGLTLLIQDTGIGIMPEDLPRIFEWGYTGFNGRGETRSTGIGLNLCEKALTMLGHRIEIQSELGTGTKVSIDLYRTEFEVD